jgi:putative ABC transport system substrate-binding protein
MRRRDFIGFASGAVAWPLAAQAQQPGKLPTIGFLTTGTAGPWIEAFQKRLRELGRIDGRTVVIESRLSEGRPELIEEFLAEFVRLKVDVIVTGGNGVLAAKRATSTIPILFPVAVDPVGSGFVASLARPGGNVTGFSLRSTDLAAKRVELLREIFPDLHRLAVLADVAYPAALREMGEVQVTAGVLGIEVDRLELRRAEDVVPAFQALKSGAQALYLCTDQLVSANFPRINDLALGAHLPTICGVREYLQGGGFVSYGPSFADLYRRSADLVDKILRGSRPSEIPVEQPILFELAINLKTAKALAITVSPTLLARADEVIE